MRKVPASLSRNPANRASKDAPQLSPDSQRRIEENPMRVLDSKDENDRKLTAAMPMITDHLCAEC